MATGRDAPAAGVMELTPIPSNLRIMVPIQAPMASTSKGTGEPGSDRACYLCSNAANGA